MYIQVVSKGSNALNAELLSAGLLYKWNLTNASGREIGGIVFKMFNLWLGHVFHSLTNDEDEEV